MLKLLLYFRWNQGLLFHHAVVDCVRSLLLLPIGQSILKCQDMSSCGLLETSFLLLVTASTINLLTTVLNDSPVITEEPDEFSQVTDSPQCVLFGTFIIWFASFTINLGPTFLSGSLAAGSNDIQMANIATCPLIWGPFRHYVLNVLWIMVNVICLVLTAFNLKKLHRDIQKSNSELVRANDTLLRTMLSINSMAEGASNRQVKLHLDANARQRINMFVGITIGFIFAWGPLYIATLFYPSTIQPTFIQRTTLYIAFSHAFINPLLFLCLHKDLRGAIADIICLGTTYANESTNTEEGCSSYGTGYRIYM